jgi:hypothetical protein
MSRSFVLLALSLAFSTGALAGEYQYAQIQKNIQKELKINGRSVGRDWVTLKYFRACDEKFVGLDTQVVQCDPTEMAGQTAPVQVFLHKVVVDHNPAIDCVTKKNNVYQASYLIQSAPDTTNVRITYGGNLQEYLAEPDLGERFKQNCKTASDVK